MRPQRHGVRGGRELGEVVRAEEAAVTREGPHKAGLPGVDCHEAACGGEEDEDFEDDGAGFRGEGLREEFEVGDHGGGEDDGVEVGEGEEDGDGVEEGGEEADEDRAEDGARDVVGGARDFFGHVRAGVCGLLGCCGARRIESRTKARESPVHTQESGEERNYIVVPPRHVDVFREDEATIISAHSPPPLDCTYSALCFLSLAASTVTVIATMLISETYKLAFDNPGSILSKQFKKNTSPFAT